MKAHEIQRHRQLSVTVLVRLNTQIERKQ
jgi:hypothetical protein